MLEEYRKALDKAMHGTILIHPEYNLGKEITTRVNKYIDYLKNGSINFERFYDIFELNDELKNYLKNNPYNDIVLMYLDNLNDFCKNMYNSKEINDAEKLILYYYMMRYKTIVKQDNKTLQIIKNNLYESIEEISKIIEFIEPITNLYIKFLNYKKSFDYNSINIKSVTNSAKEILSNVNGYHLKKTLSGTLLFGNIEVESHRGYINYPQKPQQDSVLSVVKNENCYMNVIADGAGGSKNGEMASIEINNRLKIWFSSLDENDDYRQIEYNLNNELININNYILKRYPGSYSTVVIALTINDKTIIANIGDSTAYSYDYENDNLIELTTLDSLSYGLSYEQSRHNPNNNYITSAIGLISKNLNENFAHFCEIKNNGQKIILSSDGVTDLVSENKFKSYFKNNIPAKKIVEDAIYFPDVDGILKKCDNVSAIVINLPNYNLEMDRKKR